METAVFWGLLASLVLFVVVAFLWARLGEPARSSSLLLVEPLFLFTKNWHIARFSGQSAKIERLVRLFHQTTAEPGLLSEILPRTNGKRGAQRLLSIETLGSLGEQRLVEEGSKKSSLVIGLASETLPRLLLTAAEKKKITAEADQAGEHGFLTLVVGQTAVHTNSLGNRAESLEHIFLGTILLEPTIDQKMLQAVQTLAADEKKVVTVLPKQLAEFLASKLEIAGETATLNTQEPAERLERRLQDAAIIAEANYDARYRAIRALELDANCRLLSQLPGDEKLPVKKISLPTIR